MPVERSDLRAKAIKGGAVSLTAQGAYVLIQLTSVAVLSRLLLPEDFGVIAMIVAVTAFMGLFSDLGLSTAAVQKGDLSQGQMSSLFWLNVAAGLALTLLTLGAAPVIAWFYRRPELLLVTSLLASTFLISSVGAQHSALMRRELRFRAKAVAELTGSLVNLVVAITLAMLGYRYWALAWGVVGGAVATTLLYFSLSKFRPGLPGRSEGIRELLGFGVHVTAFELVNYFHRNLDNILIGRVWGGQALGLYSRAYQMMMLPIIALRRPINAVALPVLSKLQGDPAEYRVYYRHIASALAFLSMPLMAFLVVNAEAVVVLVLGRAWADLIPIFVLLGVSGFLQPVASLRGLVMLSLGRSRRYLAWGLINALAVSVAFGIGVAWGGVGVAAAYAICNYLILYPSMHFLFKGTPLTASDFFATTALPAAASIFAGAVNYTVMSHLSLPNAALSLGVAGLVFSSSLLLLLLALPAGRAALRSSRNLLKVLRD